MNTYVKTPAPHIHAEHHTHRLFWIQAISLLPALVAGFFWHGLDALRVTVIVFLFAALAEWVFSCAGKEKALFTDGSSAALSLLLICLLPPSLPSWLAALTTVVSIGLAKEFLGGFGSVFFHPVLIGAAFLKFFLEKPLLSTTPQNFLQWLLGTFPSSIGASSGFAILIGICILIAQKAVRIEMAFVYLVTTVLGYMTFGLPWFLAFTGPMLLMAFWAGADFISSPASRSGKIFFAAGAAILTVLLFKMNTGTYSPVFAILMMNTVSPWIDYAMQCREKSAV